MHHKNNEFILAYKGVFDYQIEDGTRINLRLSEGIEKYPAPNFQELLLALKEIGEKLGWNKPMYEYGWSKTGELPHNVCGKTTEHRYHAHHLTDIFLESGMESVDKYISELIKEKVETGDGSIRCCDNGDMDEEHNCLN